MYKTPVVVCVETAVFVWLCDHWYSQQGLSYEVAEFGGTCNECVFVYYYTVLFHVTTMYLLLAAVCLFVQV